MDKKKENDVIIGVALGLLVVVFLIAMTLFGYLKNRDAADRHQTRMALMVEMSRDSDASARVRIESMTEILKAKIRSYQPLELPTTHVHSSTCGHPYSEPFYQRVWRQRRRYQSREK